MYKKLRIGISEPIYSLLLVADYKIVVAVGKAFPYKCTEIDPLQTGCVLKFIYKKVFYPDSPPLR